MCRAWSSAVALSCSRGEPPTPSASPSIAPPEVAVPVPAAVAASPSTSAPPPASADPSSLPQTHELPNSSTEAFEARAIALWEAIVRDDPDHGMPFFFPLRAYEKVKDVSDPAADWKHRLVTAYRRDIHSIHALLGEGASAAHLLALDVPTARAQWVQPGDEWNKIGYFRVFGSKLRYEVDGKVRTIDVRSLISWRGEWYVVHLGSAR
jgi:hypothetical protein